MRGADARMGDQDVAQALSRPGRLEGGAGESLRGESHDDPPLGEVGPTGAGSARRSEGVFAAPSGGSQTGSLQGDHRRAPRGVSEAVGEAAVRRGPRRGLSGLLRERAGTTCGLPGRASRSSRWSGSRRRRAGRARWTSARSRFPGAAAMPWWSCWATPGCFGCASSRVRRCRS